MRLKDFLNTDEETSQETMPDAEYTATIQVIKIKHYPDDVMRAASLLKSGDAVITDCTSLKAAVKGRANDFLVGACAMGNDQMFTIAPQIYLLTPKSILVKTDQDREDIEPPMPDSPDLTHPDQELDLKQNLDNL